MTNAATAGRLPAGSQPAGPEAARTTWPRMALLGGVLLALGVLGLLWDGAGPRLLLAGLGALAAVRGAGLLRAVRAGGRPRVAATSGALAVWLGLAAAAVALLSATGTGWSLVAGLVLAVPALALAAGGRAAASGAGVALLAGAVLLGVLAGVPTLLSVGPAVAAVLVAALGAGNLLGAVGMWRIARRPAPAPAAGCGGCACGAGGCGSLR